MLRSDIPSNTEENTNNESDFEVRVFLGKAATTPSINLLFRGDGRPPEIIHNNGFFSRGQNTDLHAHLNPPVNHQHYLSKSAFISTSRSRRVAEAFARMSDMAHCGYLYEINPQPRAINIESFIQSERAAGRITHNDYDWLSCEKEYTVPFKINRQDIKGAWRIDKRTIGSGFRSTKEFIPNPHYVPPCSEITVPLRMVGRALTGVGAAMDAANFCYAYTESIHTQDYSSVFNEGARIVGGWSGAIVLGSQTSKITGLMLRPLGPYASVAGAVIGGAAGSIAGYTGCGNMARELMQFIMPTILNFKLSQRITEILNYLNPTALAAEPNLLDNSPLTDTVINTQYPSMLSPIPLARGVLTPQVSEQSLGLISELRHRVTQLHQQLQGEKERAQMFNGILLNVTRNHLMKGLEADPEARTLLSAFNAHYATHDIEPGSAEDIRINLQFQKEIGMRRETMLANTMEIQRYESLIQIGNDLSGIADLIGKWTGNPSIKTLGKVIAAGTRVGEICHHFSQASQFFERSQALSNTPFSHELSLQGASNVVHGINAFINFIDMFRDQDNHFEAIGSVINEAFQHIKTACQMIESTWSEIQMQFHDLWRVLLYKEENIFKRFAQLKKEFEITLIESKILFATQNVHFSDVRFQINAMHIFLGASVTELLDAPCRRAILIAKQEDQSSYLRSHYPSLIVPIKDWLLTVVTDPLKTGFIERTISAQAVLAHLNAHPNPAEKLGFLSALTRDLIGLPAASLISDINYVFVLELFDTLIRYRGFATEADKAREQDVISRLILAINAVCYFFETVRDGADVLMSTIINNYANASTMLKNGLSDQAEMSQLKDILFAQVKIIKLYCQLFSVSLPSTCLDLLVDESTFEKLIQSFYGNFSSKNREELQSYLENKLNIEATINAIHTVFHPNMALNNIPTYSRMQALKKKLEVLSNDITRMPLINHDYAYEESIVEVVTHELMASATVQAAQLNQRAITDLYSQKEQYGRFFAEATIELEQMLDSINGMNEHEGRPGF